MYVQRHDHADFQDFDPDREHASAAPPPRTRVAELADLPPRETPELLAFYSTIAGKITMTTDGGEPIPVGKTAGGKLDAARDAYSGPYTVEGKQVRSAPMFWIGSYESKHTDAERVKVLGRELASAVKWAQAGPEDLVRATQKLIDAGKLPPPPGDLETRIKKMQWEWGVGIDCACYTRHALVAATGRNEASLGIAGDQALRNLDHNPNFVRVAITEVRAGDVITLDPRNGERYGHNVIIRDHTVLGDASRRDLATRHPDARAFLNGSGPFHAIEVDSSWGAGSNGDRTGGYRRDTWLFDESTQKWGHIEARSGAFAVDDGGPSFYDRFHGAYRVKGT